MQDKLVIIKCPVCGTEYLPSEIYMPRDFFGNQKEIIKKSSGEIDFYTGNDMDLNEEFVCDTCCSKLKIHANISFNVDVAKNEDFEEEYITSINKPAKIKLSESDLF